MVGEEKTSDLVFIFSIQNRLCWILKDVQGFEMLRFEMQEGEIRMDSKERGISKCFRLEM